MLSEAQRFWDAIVGKVRKVAQEVTKNTFRCERYTVTTAPNGTKMGVTLPMGSKEIFLPYSREVASATVGSQVLVVWWFSMSNAKVYFFADGYDGSAYKVYNTTRDLGFTSGSATIAGVSAAMPAPSILICDSNEFVSTDLPSSFLGTIEIKKTWANNARTVINAYGKLDSRGDYRMFTNPDSDVPTGTWVYLGQDVDYKIYNSVTDLGLTSGSATISGAWSAMPDNSILICNISAFSSSEWPTSGFTSGTFYGTIVIIKVISYRGSIYAYGKTAEHGDWRMYLVDGTNVPSGTWVIASGDSGWITATLSSSFVPYGNYAADTPKYRKIGNIVEIEGIVSPSSEISDSSVPTTVFTLPSGYRPTRTRNAVCQGSWSNKFLLRVEVTGDVQISRYGTTSFDPIPTTAWLPFNMTFFIG